MTEIRTKRLRIGEISSEHEEELMDLLCDRKIGETFLLPEYEEREAARPLAVRYEKLSADPARFVAGIFLEDLLIGLVNEVDRQEGAMEIGYLIRPELWNRGYATEMLQAVLPALHGRGFSRVIAGYFEENPASGRVMEKAGMHPLSRTDSVEHRGKVHRCLYYESTLEEMK